MSLLVDTCSASGLEDRNEDEAKEAAGRQVMGVLQRKHVRETVAASDMVVCVGFNEMMEECRSYDNGEHLAVEPGRNLEEEQKATWHFSLLFSQSFGQCRDASRRRSQRHFTIISSITCSSNGRSILRRSHLGIMSSEWHYSAVLFSGRIVSFSVSGVETTHRFDRTIFTGGSDCLVRIHRADDPDSEPGFHDDHTDAITSLSCSVSCLVQTFSSPADMGLELQPLHLFP